MNDNLPKCPKCLNKELWKTTDKRYKCKNCRYLFSFKQNNLNISNEKINQIISEFVLEHPLKIILERVDISKYKLIKFLTLLRKIIDLNFYQEDKIIKTKQPIIGIIERYNSFFAQIIPPNQEKEIKILIKNNSLPYCISLKRYCGIVLKDYLYRFPWKKEKRKISSLENFWGYLKRKLSAKGGIRKDKLQLYLKEYSWRYNHKKISLKEKEKILLNIVFNYFESTNKSIPKKDSEVN